MKKLLFLFALYAFTADAQIATPRFGTTPNSDNTGRVITYNLVVPDTAVRTTTLAPNASITYVAPAPIKLNKVFNVSLATSHKCDEMIFMFKGAGTADSGTQLHDSIIWGTGFQATTTSLLVDSIKVSTAHFIFNGSKWVELSRAKQ